MKTIHEVEETGTTAGPTGPRERWHEKSREELEAEMASLREQLRSAHASMSRTHAQMEVQKKRTRQLVAAWKVRLEEGEEKSRRQKEILDQQMQKVVADLMFFEGALRKEQKDIKISLKEKDEMITSQKRTIDSLLAANIALTKGFKKLKRKFKESVRTSPDVTSEGHSNWSIQQEADALISQIFSNRNNSYNNLPSGEMVDESVPEVTEEVPTIKVEFEPVSVEGVEDGSNTGDDNVHCRVNNTDPHVFFCLTESKGEKSPSLNFKTTTFTYPIMYADNTVEHSSPSISRSEVVEGDYETSRNHNETNVENGDWFGNNGMRTQVEQQPVMFEISPSKSCPNLGLAAIAEETNFVPDRGRTRSESEEFLLDNDVYDVDDVDSDVFTASHNSCSSVSALECSFSSSVGGVEDCVYENLPADDNSLLLRRQAAFDQASIEQHDPGSGVHSMDRGNGELEVEPPDDSKWKQIRSPPRTSSFNLLRRIRRPRDLKKKKAARTNSDSTGDTSKNPPVERQRKLTI